MIKLVGYLVAFLKWMDIMKYTKEEKIARARNKYKNDLERFAPAVFRIEKVDEIKDREEYYLKMIDICAEYKLNWTIPCSGGC
ncbi:hypothetical protein BMS3Abin15_00426 [bacterium BMS3Abin15]|nr:hypothetical protein BMS3Abin15_00426 [bacterium BMS3Abin15]HDZ85040.1 hypothetical protein [Candidatus Moranbacteria bacterium]